MKQKLPVPFIIAIAVVVLGGLGFFAWKQAAASSSDEQPFAPKMGNPVNPPHSREEGMKMMHGGH